MRAYQLVFQVCSQKNPHDLTADMYAYYRWLLHDHLHRAAECIRHAPEAELLAVILRRYQMYLIVVAILKRIFSYLDRWFVPEHRLDPIEAFALKCWTSEVGHGQYYAMCSVICKAYDAVYAELLVQQQGDGTLTFGAGSLPQPAVTIAPAYRTLVKVAVNVLIEPHLVGCLVLFDSCGSGLGFS